MNRKLSSNGICLFSAFTSGFIMFAIHLYLGIRSVAVTIDDLFNSNLTNLFWNENTNSWSDREYIQLSIAYSLKPFCFILIFIGIVLSLSSAFLLTKKYNKKVFSATALTVIIITILSSVVITLCLGFEYILEMSHEVV